MFLMLRVWSKGKLVDLLVLALFFSLSRTPKPTRFTRVSISSNHPPSLALANITSTVRYAVMVTGPAGAGKSTFCASLITHAQSLGRSVHLFNLDPAADKFEYPPSIDIKDLISLDEVMEDLELGPNGGLIYCFE